jgi:hypothetical protein
MIHFAQLLSNYFIAGDEFALARLRTVEYGHAKKARQTFQAGLAI